MRFSRTITLSCVLAGAVGVTACGSDSDSGSGGGGSSAGGGGGELTIYSSLPLQGTSRGQSEAVIQGEQLAFEKLAPGGKIGNYTLKYESLDDSTAQNPGTADEGKTAQNARQAVRDDTTIAYLGEFNSGGTKISLPILNQAGIPQLSPSNTYGGLTTDEPGAEPGEPDRYYPSRKRTYLRIVPRDKIQGAALVSVMQDEGCQSLTLWDDQTTYGAGLARNIEQSAEAAGLPIDGRESTDKNAPNYRSLASNIESDCFAWAGVTGENGVQVFKDAAAAAPDAQLYGPDGVAEAAFADPKEGGVPKEIGDRTTVTVATLGTKDLPEASDVLEQFRQKYKTEDVDPYAIYGYETMAVTLDSLKKAIEQGGASDVKALREALLEQLFAVKDRSSVVGTYSFDANGDTSLTDYGIYKINNGELEYQRKIEAEAGA